MSVSLSEFFCVEVELHELKRCLDYTSSECKLAAWYGDAILAKFVSQRLYREAQRSIGVMSRKKAHYVSNTTMKTFLLDHTDASSRLSDVETMSDHSFGTVFEALLELCNRKSGSVITKDCVKRYCDWVDKNTAVLDSSFCISYSHFATGMKSSSCFSSLVLQSPDSREEFFETVEDNFVTWVGEIAALKASERKLAAGLLKTPAIELGMPMGQTLHKSSPSTTDVSGHIHDKKATAEWRSNSKYWYEDSYYRCCGVREGVLTCLRPLWIDATDSCHHPGDLNIPDKKGEFQRGASQYGRGKTPIWTCCSLTALSPGCVSNQQGNYTLCEITGKRTISTQYKAKLNRWMREYEDVVMAERVKEIGPGGIVHSG